MREEYDFSNARKNPYTKDLKQQITITLDQSVIIFFKDESKKTGIPYKKLINMYLVDCLNNKRKLNTTRD